MWLCLLSTFKFMALQTSALCMPTCTTLEGPSCSIIALIKIFPLKWPSFISHEQSSTFKNIEPFHEEAMPLSLDQWHMSHICAPTWENRNHRCALWILIWIYKTSSWLGVLNFDMCVVILKIVDCNRDSTWDFNRSKTNVVVKKTSHNSTHDFSRGNL